MERNDLLQRIVSDPQRCGGRPCIKGTRIEVSIILGALAEGLTPEEVRDHYPWLAPEDIRAAIAYGAELARESVWKLLPA